MDANRGSAALLIGLLLDAGQRGLPDRSSADHRGQGRTDAKDARVLADQARLRQDLGQLRPGDEVSVDLRILAGRRLDLVNDRIRLQESPAHHPLPRRETIERPATTTERHGG
ncbi:transposase [Streptomyces sp. VRA16 Mangrove soil]|nr:transposase [Streptomyces sp. VRA16 Mangrove soil]